jgi:hypothetical protein
MTLTLLNLEKAIRSQGFTTVEENGDLFILQKEKQIITTLRIEEDKKRVLIRSHIQALRIDESRRAGVVEFFNVLNGHADLYASFYVDHAGACWITGLVSLRGSKMGSSAFENIDLAPALLSCVRGAERLREVFDQFPDQSFDVIAAAEFFFSGGQVLPGDL